jgi:hypothetical protein
MVEMADADPRTNGLAEEGLASAKLLIAAAAMM